MADEPFQRLVERRFHVLRDIQRVSRPVYPCTGENLTVRVGGFRDFRRCCIRRKHNVLLIQQFHVIVQAVKNIHKRIANRFARLVGNLSAEEAVVCSSDNLRAKDGDCFIIIGFADEFIRCAVEDVLHVIGDFQRIACPAFPCTDEEIGVDIGVKCHIGVLGILRQRGDCKDCHHQGEEQGNQLLHGDVPAFQKVVF